MAMSKDFEELIPLAERVIDQTKRRVLHEEKVPAEEKVVSIFEPHADIIIKDRRDTYFGHKVCLTGGPSNFISDCLAGIESGISWLKRSFGFSRCTWKSFESFKSYVWSCIVSANLFTLASVDFPIEWNGIF